MSAMKTLCLCAVALVVAPWASARAGSAAESTWTGQISDSACGAKHEEAAEGQGKMPDRDCTQACVRGGSKYVLVVQEERDGSSRATVLQIANQDNTGLATHAGHTVRVTGELKGGAITISKIVMP
jgi:opacity protein-like surface antigen